MNTDHGTRYLAEVMGEYYLKLLMAFDKAMKKHGIDDKTRLEINITLNEIWRKEKWNYIKYLMN